MHLKPVTIYEVIENVWIFQYNDFLQKKYHVLWWHTNRQDAATNASMVGHIVQMVVWKSQQ